MQRSRLLIILSLAVLLMLVVVVSTKKPKKSLYEIDFAIEDLEDFEDFEDDVPLIRVKKDRKAKKKAILALKKKVLEDEVEKDEEADVDKIGGSDNDLTTAAPSTTIPMPAPSTSEAMPQAPLPIAFSTTTKASMAAPSP